MAKRKKPRVGDLVIVDWLDAVSPKIDVGNSWKPQGSARRLKVMWVRSVGIQAKAGKRTTVLMGTVARHHEGEIQAIPTAVIRRMDVVRRGIVHLVDDK